MARKAADPDAPPKPKKPPKFIRDMAEHLAANGGRLVPSPTNPLCGKCGLDDRNPKHPYLQPTGSNEEHPLATIVMDSVSRREDEAGELTSAGNAAFIRKAVAKYAQDIGFDPERIRYTSTTLCCAREGKLPNYKTHGNWCRHHLVQDLQEHSPEIIIPVGTVALGLLSHKSNANDWAGRLLTYRGWPDEWITDHAKRLVAETVYGPQPTQRRAIMPVQSIGIAFGGKNPVLMSRWQADMKRALRLAVQGIPAMDYERPWFRITTDPEEVIRAMEWLIAHPGTKLTYDTETTGLYTFDKDEIVYMMFRWNEPSGTKRSIGFPWAYKELPGVPDTYTSPMLPHIARLTPYVLQALYVSRLRGHNLTFDILFTYANLEGADLNRLCEAMYEDTRLMLFTLRQQPGSLGLDLVAYDHCPDMAGYEEEMTLLIEQREAQMSPSKGGHYANCPPELHHSHLRPYVMGDVEVCHEAAERIRPKLVETGTYDIPLAHPSKRGRFSLYTPPNRLFVHDKIIAPANRMLTKIMGRGNYVEMDELAAQEDSFPKRINEAKAKLRICDERIIAWTDQMEATEPGWELDLEKKDHMKTILFDQLGMPIKRLTKGGRKIYGEDYEDFKDVPRDKLLEVAACDKFTLNMMAVENPSLRVLLEYRKVHKQYTTYVRPMRNILTAGIDKKARTKHQYLMRDGCVHPSYLLAGTRGGRLCVAGDTVLEVRVGSDSAPSQHIEISNLWKLSGHAVFTRTHRNRWRRIKSLFFKGQEEMYKVHGAHGGVIEATAGHNCSGVGVWVPVGELAIGRVLAVAPSPRAADPVSYPDQGTPLDPPRQGSLRSFCVFSEEEVATFQLAPSEDGHTEGDEQAACRYAKAVSGIPFETLRRVPRLSSGCVVFEGVVAGETSVPHRPPPPHPFCSEEYSGYTEVTRIEATGARTVWDIEVEEDHSYCAGGFVHHNSCKEPNQQNQAKDGEIKALFSSRFGKILGAIYHGDLSQIELRLLAAACGDPSMVDAYWKGLDLHSLTTEKIFKIPYENFSKDYAVWAQKNGREKEVKDLELKRRVGKCVHPETLITLNGELRRIGSMSPKDPSDDTFYPLTDKRIAVPNGGQAPCVNFYNNGVGKRILVCSTHGILACSENHRLQLADGSLVRAADIKKKDVLAPVQPLSSGAEEAYVPMNPFLCEKVVTPHFLAWVAGDLAYVAGLFVGDGCANENCVKMATGTHGKYLEWQKIMLAAFLGIGLTVSAPAVDNAIYLGSRHVMSVLGQLGLTENGKRVLRVPESIFNATRGTKMEFIGGMIDTDGYVSKTGVTSICTKQWELAQDLLVLLQTCGIHAALDVSWNKKYKRHYYQIRIARRHQEAYAPYVRCPWKKERIDQTLPVRFVYTKVPPNRVSMVKYIEDGPLVDVEVGTEEHLYLANGLVTHNTVNFLTGYGGGALGLMNTLANQGIYLSLEECEEIIEAFFSNYPTLKSHIALYKRFILENGCAVALTGRVRVFDEVYGEDQEAIAKAMRAGYNHLIQSTASDMMLVCLCAIENLMRDAKLESMLVATVHDSLLIDARRDELDSVHEIVTYVLANIPEVMQVMLGDGYDNRWMQMVPFSGDVGVGKSFLDERKLLVPNPDWDQVLDDDRAAA